MSAPVMSIGIPSYNREAFLKECLQSCLTQKGTSPESYEIVVSNNSSTDGTENYLKELSSSWSMKNPKLTILHQNPGISPMENWQACLDKARGEYFLLLSDDDTVEQGLVAEIIHTLTELKSERPAAILVGFRDIDHNGHVRRVVKNRPNKIKGAAFFRELIFRKQRYRWCAVVARKDLLLESQVFKLPFPGSGMFADGAAMLACCIKGDIFRVSKPLVSYRVHSGNDSRRPDFDANRRGHQIFIEFAEKLSGGKGGWSERVRFWCAEGTIYQLARWLVKKQLSPREVLATLANSKKLTAKMDWGDFHWSYPLRLELKQKILMCAAQILRLFSR